MNSDLLQIDVDLLLCRYSRDRVIAALARSTGDDEAELRGRIGELQRKKEGKRRKRPLTASLVSRAEAELGNDLPKLNRIRPIASAFDSGFILPTVRSIQSFLESRGQSYLSIKSRKAAGPTLLREFSNMSPEELNEFRQGAARESENDFSLLSEAILNSNKRQ